MNQHEFDLETLRRDLRDLVDDEVDGEAPVADVIRRGRSRRRTKGVVVGLVCAAAASIVWVGASGFGADRGSSSTNPGSGVGTSAAPSTSSSAAAPSTAPSGAPTSAGPALTPRTVTPGVTPTDPGPLAEPGRAYPHDWYAHCGLGHLRFAGRVWQADTAVERPPNLPGPQGPGSGPQLLPGYVTLTDAGHARFDGPGFLSRPITLTAVASAPTCE